MKTTVSGLAVLLGALMAGSAWAHHSYGMFDRQKEVTLKGTVEQFQWTNPHCRIDFAVPNTDGKMTSWDIEIGPPGQLVRSGWNRLSLKSGDKVEILINPLHDGKLGGHLLTVKTVDGKVLSDGIAVGLAAKSKL